MNLGLTTSFIVAGILILSILSMNSNISHSSTELTMRQVTQQRAGTIAEILQKDISNIGSDVNSGIPSPITIAQTNVIEFESNIDNSGSSETISWEFTDTDASGSKNPNDKILIRKVDGHTAEFRSGVTSFDLRYLNKDRIVMSTPIALQEDRDKIRYIEISFTVQSKEPIGGAGTKELRYIETSWTKQFTPINLTL